MPEDHDHDDVGPEHEVNDPGEPVGDDDADIAAYFAGESFSVQDVLGVDEVPDGGKGLTPGEHPGAPEDAEEGLTDEKFWAAAALAQASGEG